MLCDFSDGVEVITFLGLLPQNMTERPKRPDKPRIPLPRMPPLPSPPKPPPGWHGSLQKDSTAFFQAYATGGWHDHAPGETRVHLDYTGLLTFYDPTLSSLVEARQEKDRMHYRIEGISSADTERILLELRSVLTRKQSGGSGVDWGSIARVVMERYAERLEYLRFLLSPNATFTDAAEQAATARGHLLVMLAPYITTADIPQELPASADPRWAAPVAQRCSTTQTSGIPLGLLTPQEVRIHAAVEGTLREICRRLMLVWLEFFDVEAESEAKAAEAIELGRRHIDELMSWLDWSLWVRCEPACGFGVRDTIASQISIMLTLTVACLWRQEICYLPTWPFLTGEDPYDMTPRCVSLKDVIP
jgi:hypothetical protein